MTSDSDRGDAPETEVLSTTATVPADVKDVSPVHESSWQERLGRALGGWDHNRRVMEQVRFKKSLTLQPRSTKL